MLRRARSWRGMQAGAYTLVRRWRWAQAAARLYEAFHTRTGAAALVLKPGSPADWKPAAAPWSAVVSSTPEAIAVEFRPMPRSPAALEEVTLAFYRLTGALAQVEGHPAAQSALAGDVAAARRWRAQLSARQAVVAALALVALAAMLAAPRLYELVAARAVPGPAGAVQLAPAVEAAPVVVAPRAKLRPGMLALDMPAKPFRGQVLARNGKCEGRAERVILGACWVELSTTAPCDDRSYEHAGRCYLPVWPAPAEPQASLLPNP